MPESEAWRKSAGKRGLEEGSRKTRLEGREPENEALRKGAGKRGFKGALRHVPLFFCSTSCFQDNASPHNTQCAYLSLQYIVLSRQCQPTQHSVCISFSAVHRAFQTMPAYTTLSVHLFLCSTLCFPDNASLHNTQCASLSL